ncbi:MAG: DUF2934 domain-containing protein [Methyloglobulus sp.]|nr:DUF2934 domain-containing protein [Methyloglobulus sp.]
METMIAEAAYYKAEKRNFYRGHEIRDWLEAKRGDCPSELNPP